MRSSSAIITPEGYPFIAYAAGLTVFLTAGSLLLTSGTLVLGICAVISLLLTVFVVSFFRNPERVPPAEPDVLVAPADGEVVYVGPANEDHLGSCTKISIFMSVFNVHVNRAPYAGVVRERFYRQGRFLDARHAKASAENEQCGLVLDLTGGVQVVCVQIAGLIARRILCYADVGEQVTRGGRYGLIRFGSRVDLYVPTSVTPLVKVGEKTTAGLSAVARMPVGERA